MKKYRKLVMLAVAGCTLGLTACSQGQEQNTVKDALVSETGARQGGEAESLAEKDNAPEEVTKEAKEQRDTLGDLHLTYEEVKKLDGYIDLTGPKLVGLFEDGYVKAYNSAKSEPAFNQGLEGFDRSSAVKVAVGEDDDSFVLIGENGKAAGILDCGYDWPVIEGVTDVGFNVGGGTQLSILCADGTVWSSRYSTDPAARIEGISNVKEMRCSKSGLAFTLEDGTVEMWTESGRTDYMIEEVCDWTDIQVAVWDEYSLSNDEVGYFAAGLKSDGTVVATGEYADFVKDWSDVVWLESGRGIVAGLTSDGRVLAAGHEVDNTKYRNPDKSISDPAEWTNIVAIDVGGYMGGMIGLTADGEILGCFGGSEGEKGIGPGK